MTVALRVATFNVRNVRALDRASCWLRRRHLLDRAIASVDADIWALQEVYAVQRRFLSASSLSGHHSVGDGRNRRGTGESLPVFVRDGLVDVGSWSVRWFGDTPTLAGSRIAGASFPRIVTFATVRSGGREFVVANVHLDERSAPRRLQSTDQLVGWLADFVGMPLVVLGDFNAPADGPELRPLAEAGLRPVLDARHGGTSHGFGRHRPRAIDNVWVTPHWEVGAVEVVRDAEMASDHWPVVASLSLP